MVLRVVLEFVVFGRFRPTLLILNGGCNIPSVARQNYIFFHSALLILVGCAVCYFTSLAVRGTESKFVMMQVLTSLTVHLEEI